MRYKLSFSSVQSRLSRIVLFGSLGLFFNTIFACSMGKGIAGPVTVNGRNITANGWNMTWWLYGEQQQVFSPTGGAAPWQPVTASSPAANDTRLWFKTHLDLPSTKEEGPADGPVAFALDLSSMNKGKHVSIHW